MNELEAKLALATKSRTRVTMDVHRAAVRGLRRGDTLVISGYTLWVDELKPKQDGLVTVTAWSWDYLGELWASGNKVQ